MKQFLLLVFLWPICLFSQDLFFNRIGNFTFSNPVDIVSTGIAEDDRLFIVQKGGAIKIVDNISLATPTLISGNFLNKSVNAAGEGGLLGLVFDPDYKTNGYFYIYYTQTSSGQFTSFVSRFEVNDWKDNVAIANSETVILTIPQLQNNHNGGDLAFSPDGYLFISLGDGGGGGDPGDNGQDSTSLLGSLLRIDVSSLPYSIPSGNPYANDPGKPGEIWSHGWRNPWRFFMDNVSGNLIVGDVGQGQREEINIESTTVGGNNFGWNCYEGSLSYDLTDCENFNQYVSPVFEYNRSQGRSVTGGVVYRGAKYSALYGKYIFTDYLNSSKFWILTLVGDQVTGVETPLITGNVLSRVASMGVDNQGEMYAAEYSSGELHTISSTVLPLTLESFTGNAYENYNELQWTTISEENFDYFSIEKNEVGGAFREIGSIDGQRNISGKNEYLFKDDYVKNDALYRLKMVDLDQTFTYSKIVSIKRSEEDQLSIYPNPAGDYLYISNPGSKSLYYYIVNEIGQIIKPVTISVDSKISINTSDLPEGNYFINIEDAGNEKIVKQFIVTH